ncbi:hypothetical protein [Clostridium neonatale]|uniref:hypothetical protein n=1 Tax=Clostridium neonatale TaxID=137838 RepID=UPI00291B385C|nr:hypothetical protein CNEO3_1040019 [Clostridium neonatale]CAI3559213.1 hypothetical protein CNEO3_1100019 [Clostridium neonatale]CAI3561947.1 hypothetical protein CNEO3_1180019 [Clostridium neonatale]CAI3563216.1 hypothetical protein CNEO3_1140019 [Clostridium neonatale]CAI3564776.1 hypothetical protein CNEO3_1140019 [Clostridium neonatale]
MENKISSNETLEFIKKMQLLNPLEQARVLGYLDARISDPKGTIVKREAVS